MTEKIRLVQRLETIRDFCRGKTVLHLGCTNYPYTEDAIAKEMLLHSDLDQVARDLVGFDFDQAGIDILASRGTKNLYRADLEKLEEVMLQRTFEVIVAGEMIEHLNNPGLFLEGIKRFMDERSVLLITTINAYCAMRNIAYAFRGQRGMNEPVHPDHVAYYSYSTLNLLVRRHGFIVDEFMFYDIGNEHRPHNSRIYNLINDVAVRVSPQLADGVIAVCRIA
jgi:SAM-dependent methyltransferase